MSVLLPKADIVQHAGSKNTLIRPTVTASTCWK
jgi:hypothetical protein